LFHNLVIDNTDITCLQKVTENKREEGLGSD
jgi:hypothetical protein